MTDLFSKEHRVQHIYIMYNSTNSSNCSQDKINKREDKNGIDTWFDITTNSLLRAGWLCIIYFVYKDSMKNVHSILSSNSNCFCSNKTQIFDIEKLSTFN